MNTIDKTINTGKSTSHAARLAATLIDESSLKARRTQRVRKEVAAIEAQARADGFLDDEGFFIQSTDEFLAETGLCFRSSSSMGLGF